jgi:tetratricopeptide (TPR) repeat protein
MSAVGMRRWPVGEAQAVVARLVDAGRQDMADQLAQACEGEPDDSTKAWFALGAALQVLGEDEAAIDAYRIVLELNYADVVAHRNLSGLLLRSGQHRLALVSSKMVMKYGNGVADMALPAAEAAWRLGRAKEALHYLDLSMTAGLHVARCLDLKARLALQAKDFHQVIRIAESSWSEVEHDDWALHAMTNAYDSALYALGRGSEGPLSKAYPEITLEAVRSAWDELARRCPNFAQLLPIHVIGDSHSTFFTGLNYHQFCGIGAPQMLPSFRAYNVGASLAYTLNKPVGRGARQRPLFQFLSSGVVPAGAVVMLSFGEIDGRVHVLKQAEKQGRSVADVQRDSVESYMAALEEVIRMGFRPMVWAPIGSMPEVSPHPSMYPSHGSMSERNRARSEYIQLLEEACGRRRIPVVSIFSAMVNSDMETDTRWLIDGLHLNQRAMGPTLAAFHTLFTCHQPG